MILDKQFGTPGRNLTNIIVIIRIAYSKAQQRRVTKQKEKPLPRAGSGFVILVPVGLRFVLFPGFDSDIVNLVLTNSVDECTCHACVGNQRDVVVD